MSLEHIVVWLVIGAVSGWIAGVIVTGGGFGLLIDILIGIVGAFIGGWLASYLGISMGSGFVGEIVIAVIGAVILLVAVRLIRTVI